MKIVNNFGGIDKEIYNIGDILHKVGKNYLKELPIVCNENGEDFEDYRIYGSTGGVGDRTVNLFDKNAEGVLVGYRINSIGNIGVNASTTVSDYMPIMGDEAYTIIGSAQQAAYGNAFYDSNKNLIGVTPTTATVTAPSNAAFLRITMINENVPNAMVVVGTTAPAEYVLYGYEVDMSVLDGTTSTTTPIYIGDTPLESDEYIDYDSGKIYRMVNGILTPTDPPVSLPSIPTINGKTTVSYAGTGIAPEKAWFSGMEFEIEDIYFGDKHIFSVWGEYDGILPAQYSANGDYLADYRIYGSAGGVGDKLLNLFDKNAKDTANGYEDGKVLRPDGTSPVVSGQDSYFTTEYIEIPNNATNLTLVMNSASFVSGICFYNANKEYISGVSNNSNTSPAVISCPTGAVYFRTVVYKPYVDEAMVVAGSTAPAEYVPYGYKVPMGVRSANLFDISSTTANKYVNPNNGAEMNYTVGAYMLSDYIDVSDVDTITVSSTVGDAVSSSGAHLNLYDTNKNWVRGYNAYLAGPAYSKKTFTADVFDVSYVRVDYAMQYLQENSLVAGSVPLPYQPYFNITTPIYIGDTPLSEDEYVDYGEQKVYRRTENLVGIFESVEINGIRFKFDGARAYISGTASAVIASNNANFKILKITLLAGTYSIMEFRGQVQTGFGGWVMWAVSDNTRIAYSNTTFTLNEDTEVYIGFYVVAGSVLDFSIGFVILPESEGAITEYIPYYDPQDPPVPLPALPTVDGTNIVDYAGQSVAPSRFYAKYRKG